MASASVYKAGAVYGLITDHLRLLAHRMNNIPLAIRSSKASEGKPISPRWSQPDTEGPSHHPHSRYYQSTFKDIGFPSYETFEHPGRFHSVADLEVQSLHDLSEAATRYRTAPRKKPTPRLKLGPNEHPLDVIFARQSHPDHPSNTFMASASSNSRPVSITHRTRRSGPDKSGPKRSNLPPGQRRSGTGSRNKSMPSTSNSQRRHRKNKKPTTGAAFATTTAAATCVQMGGSSEKSTNNNRTDGAATLPEDPGQADDEFAPMYLGSKSLGCLIEHGGGSEPGRERGPFMSKISFYKPVENGPLSVKKLLNCYCWIKSAENSTKSSLID